MGAGVDWCSLGEELPPGFVLPETPPDPWAPIDLKQSVKDWHTGKSSTPRPSQLTTAMGDLSLIYPGKGHVFAGEPESCKGWLLILACIQRLNCGGRILYLDFEDNADTFTQRMLCAGASPTDMLTRVIYMRPEGAPGDMPAIVAEFGAPEPGDIGVIDGVSEAFAALGMDDYREAALFLNTFVRPIMDAGWAVCQIDHVTKDRETRGRYPIGGQGKLSGADVVYSVEAIEIPCVAPGRERDGWAVVRKQKDRPGGVPGGRSQQIARLDVTAADGPAKLQLSSLDLDANEVTEKITELLLRNPEKGLGLGQIKTWSGFPESEIAKAARALDADPCSGVVLVPHGQTIQLRLSGCEDPNLDEI